MSEACRRPEIEYPARVPMKVMGKEGVLDPASVAALIRQHLGQGPEDEIGLQRKGPWISYTFWVTLPNGEVEGPLRKAIQELPGVAFQL